MTYMLIVRCDGEDIASVPSQGSLASAKLLAEELRSREDAYSIRLIEVDGSKSEAASINRDSMVWDDE